MQEAGSISMHVYAYADVTLASLVPLPELEDLDGISKPRIHCRLALGTVWSDRSWEFVHDWIDVQGIASLSLFRDRDHFLLRFADLADFYLDPTASHIEILPHASTTEETLRHLLLDQVLPRCLAHQGRLAIHGSSVELSDGKVVVFLAESGSGKSTLGASFHDAGYRLLSDDGMIITPCEQSVQIAPTYTSLRLWPESVNHLYSEFAESPQLAPMAHYSKKHRVLLRSNKSFNDRAGILAGIYLLQPTDPQATAAAERLSARDAVVELIRNSFQLDVSDRRQAAERTALACDVCEQVPAYRLTVPRDFARLPEVRDIILRQQA